MSVSSVNEASIHLDNAVRGIVYSSFITQGASIARTEVAARLAVAEEQVAASFRRLAESHMLVLQPISGEVLMANPFSAVPTAFRVQSGPREWWANCIWDGLGVIAMIGQDGRVQTSCPDCGEALSISVAGGSLALAEGFAHFAVPAAHWWDDVVFT